MIWQPCNVRPRAAPTPVPVEVTAQAPSLREGLEGLLEFTALVLNDRRTWWFFAGVAIGKRLSDEVRR